MRKFLLMAVATFAILALASCGSSDGPNLDGFSVGYGSASILPEESEPLSGFGNTMMRMSEGVLLDCRARAVAVTDEKGETIVMVTNDIISLGDSMTKELLDAICAKCPELKRENIVLESSHTHSMVDTSQNSYSCVQRYRTKFVQWEADAVRAALDDRSPATMHFGKTETYHLTFVRHFLMNDGTYSGNNFGSTASGYKDYEDPADEEMRFLVFKREDEKEDLILTFFQGHPTFYGRTNYDCSPDFCGEYVKCVEDHYDGKVKCLYFQGSCGEQNASSTAEAWSDQIRAHNAQESGQLLSEYAIDVYDNQLKEIPVGDVGICWYGEWEAEINHSEDWKIQGATIVNQDWTKYNDQSRATVLALQYELNSPYHASAVIRKFGLGKTQTVTGTGALHIGDVFASAIVPCEHFHLGSLEYMEESPFECTVNIAYAANHMGYVPLEINYEHDCYEVNNTNWAKGTGERQNGYVMDCLNQLKSGSTESPAK